MTWQDREGADGVQPVELVTFTRGVGGVARVWRLCTGDVSVVAAGLTYAASTLTRSPIRRDQTSGKSSLTLTLAAATPVVQAWLAADPLDLPGAMAVTIQRAHVATDGTLVDSGDRVGAFVGTVRGVTLDGVTATIECSSVGEAFDTPIPRIPIAATCPWSVYSTRCGLKPSDFDYTGTVASVGTVASTASLAGLPTVTLTMSGSAPLLFMTDLDERAFDGGTLTLTVDGRQVRLYLQSADLTAWPSVTAVLGTALPSSAVGASVTVWMGCQKTVEICRDRFANVNHFGGFPRLPSRNPLREGLR